MAAKPSKSKTISTAQVSNQLPQEQVELFAAITFKIRQSLQLKEILRTTVTDVRDPTAEVADCLLEFVEQFGVKAKLIVPILHSLSVHPPRKNPPTTMIWGLLIAHQCDRPRQWQDAELELMQRLADQISIALVQGELWGYLEEMVADRTAELQAANFKLQQEINERKQVESALRQSEEQLRLITNALPVLIADVDDQECYQFNNQAYVDWLWQSPTVIHGHHLRQVWGEDCYQRMAPHIHAALSGQTVTYENEIDLQDGSTRSVNVTYITHYDVKQRISGFFALTSDISEHKAIERMKDEFISVVSHELRTPLTSLHSALQVKYLLRKFRFFLLNMLSSQVPQLCALPLRG